MEKMVNPKKLKAAPYNPRIISDEELEGLKTSIKEFGFVQPIIVNKKTGYVVGGHQRIKAAIELDLKEVPVKYLSLTEQQEKALNVALNNHTIQGKFDLETLPTLLEEIKIDFPDLYEDLRMPHLEKDLGIFFDTDIEDRPEAARELSAEERKEVFDNNPIKQIHLFYDEKAFYKVVSTLDDIIKDQALESHSGAVEYLIKVYEKTKHRKK